MTGFWTLFVAKTQAVCLDNDVTFWQNANPTMMYRWYLHSWPDFTVILNKDCLNARSLPQNARIMQMINKVNRKCWVLLCSGCQTRHDDIKIAFSCTARSRKNDVVLRWGDGVLREREWLKTRLTVSAQHAPASSPLVLSNHPRRGRTWWPGLCAPFPESWSRWSATSWPR